MKKEIIVSAKSVDEAVAKAVEELGASSKEKIEYTVIEEAKKGFLGIGSTDAKISATYTAGGEENALEFVKTLLANMNIEADVEMVDGEAGEKRIIVSGESAANKRVDGKKEEYVRITVDVEGYRAKREETLRALARRMASKVQKYKKSVMLEPMNPYERRIIHSEIQNIKGVSTNSIGSENNRKIVIFLDEEAK